MCEESLEELDEQLCGRLKEEKVITIQNAKALYYRDTLQ